MSCMDFMVVILIYWHISWLKDNISSQTKFWKIHTIQNLKISQLLEPRFFFCYGIARRFSKQFLISCVAVQAWATICDVGISCSAGALKLLNIVQPCVSQPGIWCAQTQLEHTLGLWLFSCWARRGQQAVLFIPSVPQPGQWGCH